MIETFLRATVVFGRDSISSVRFRRVHGGDSKILTNFFFFDLKNVNRMKDANAAITLLEK